MFNIASADESGIQKGNLCYGIGCFVAPQTKIFEIEHGLVEILRYYEITYELKWTNMKGRTDLEAACEGIRFLLGSGTPFYSIIVEKDIYNRWKKEEEEAFYLTYQLLATQVARGIKQPFKLWVDDKSNQYAKRPEVLRTITNYKAKKELAGELLLSVEPVNSKSYPITQMVDILLGAIVADTREAASSTLARKN